MGRTLALFLLLAGCGAALPAPTPEPGSEPLKTEQSNLLLYPVGDPASLLGRPVQVSADGAWTIADARAPGCEVAVKRSASEYSVRRTVDAGTLASMSVGYSALVGLEVKYGRGLTATTDVVNTEVLTADTRGPCGAVIVDKVFVGHGKRTLHRSAQAGGRAGARIGPVTPGLAVESGAEVVDTTEWATPQAYGFTYRKVESVEPLYLAVFLPGSPADGDDVRIRIESNRRGWLVVYYIEEGGEAAVLWPSPEEPEPVVEPGRQAVIPSDAERAAGIRLEARLRDPEAPARETLVVYAFADKADFDRLKPPPGAIEKDGAAYAADLTARIGEMPIGRWSRLLTSYVIEPR